MKKWKIRKINIICKLIWRFVCLGEYIRIKIIENLINFEVRDWIYFEILFEFSGKNVDGFWIFNKCGSFVYVVFFLLIVELVICVKRFVLLYWFNVLLYVFVNFFIYFFRNRLCE